MSALRGHERTATPRRPVGGTLLGLLVAGVTILAGCSGGGGAAGASPTFSDPTRIDNPFLPLSSFTRCVSEGEVDGTLERSVKTRLDHTEDFVVDGVEVPAVVIEDRAFEAGKLVENTRDFYAQADDGTVYYLGEDVDDIEDGKIVGHSGAWRYGRDTQALGVAMPANPKLGDTWRFEDVPGITVEADTVTARFPFVETPDGTVHDDVIRVQEDLSPEGVSEFKLYARGIGEIRAVPWDLGGSMDLRSCR